MIKNTIDYIKNSKRAKISLVILLVLALLYSMSFIPRNIINVNENKVARIEIFKMGRRVEITDDSTIKKITDDFSDAWFIRGYLDVFMLRGSDLIVTFYNSKDKKIKSVAVLDSNSISYNGFSFVSLFGSVDYEQLESYLPELPELDDIYFDE